MRIVKYKEVREVPRIGGHRGETHTVTEFKSGLFHQWGSDFEQFDTGFVSPVTLAFIERPDGQIVKVAAENVQFEPEPTAPAPINLSDFEPTTPADIQRVEREARDEEAEVYAEIIQTLRGQLDVLRAMAANAVRIVEADADGWNLLDDDTQAALRSLRTEAQRD